MAKIQFGWSLPRGAGTPQARGAFGENIDRAFDLITGHFDAAWMIDHMQFKDADLLEGWTALTYQAARHLLTLGHRRIGLCVSSCDTPFGARLDGFRRAHEEFGLQIHDEWLFGGTIYEEGGAELAERYCAMPATERPTGLCIVNDFTAVGFIGTAARYGVQVPADVSVVGHDDLPFARYLPTALTSVGQPTGEIAHNVVELLMSRLEGYSGKSRHVIVKGKLELRESTAPVTS